MSRAIIFALRFIHGFALVAAIAMTLGYLINAGARIQFTNSRSVLGFGSYAALLFIELAVARCAWWNFASCSRRRSATLYFLWFALFTWIGWFSRNAPFRLHEVWDEHAEHAQAVRLAAIYSTWALSVAIVPALKCFGYSGHDPQHNDATTGDALLR